ncbi:MAG: DUF4431 domain-containing protein [Elusimicrobia bacterium]|nr:DUF4431 domain-containing protein [Candidatus Obscuribacterium magneticum]MCB4755465.1 DUF4431 domain-containing protein [Candidatus Obscuribacterium magneticum]
MSLFIQTFIILLIPHLILANSNGPTPCIPYEPAIVELEGVLKRETSINPDLAPPWNRPQSYWVLDLQKPICVEPGRDELGFAGASGITQVQLVVSPEQYKQYKKRAGMSVKARGSLFVAHTAHHFTDVLLSVDKIFSEKE